MSMTTTALRTAGPAHRGAARPQPATRTRPLVEPWPSRTPGNLQHARHDDPRNVPRLLGAPAAVLIVAVSLVAFLLVAVAAGVATACIWAWRTVSPAHAARSGAPARLGSARDEPPERPHHHDGRHASVPFTPARDRRFGYDL